MCFQSGWNFKTKHLLDQIFTQSNLNKVCHLECACSFRVFFHEEERVKKSPAWCLQLHIITTRCLSEWEKPVHGEVLHNKMDRQLIKHFVVKKAEERQILSNMTVHVSASGFNYS